MHNWCNRPKMNRTSSRVHYFFLGRVVNSLSEGYIRMSTVMIKMIDRKMSVYDVKMHIGYLCEKGLHLFNRKTV